MTEQQTVAILMPGDMGHGVGRALAARGHRVVTCLEGRSARTCGLAEAAGLEDLPLDELVAAAGIVLSILPPGQAVAQAGTVAAAMRRTGARPVYADMNAISPDTMARVAQEISDTGATVIDGGIIGLAPAEGRPPTRFYAAGPDCSALAALAGADIQVTVLGPGIGQASALKMVYAALTKGTFSLHTALLMAATRLGVYDALIAEFEGSQSATLKAMRTRVPTIPADSARWVDEMEEIAATFRAAGVTGAFHDGAADVLRVLSRTPFAEETRETMDRSRTLEDALAEYVRHL